MNKVRGNLKCSIFLLILSFILTAVSYCEWIACIKTEVNTLGLSLFVTSVVYLLLYYNEYEKTFFNLMVQVTQNNTMLCDYLVDFIFDCQHMFSRKNKLERIIKLYEQIHSYNFIGGCEVVMNLHGKKKKAQKIALDDNAKNYVALMDVLVESRNVAVQMLNDMAYKKGMFSKDEVDTLIENMIKESEKYRSAFFSTKKEIREKVRFEVLHQTRYHSPIKDIVK